MRDIKGVLIDLEGVVHQRRAAIPGSIEAISRLGHLNLDFRFVTNTTRLPLRLIVDELKNVGIIAEPLHVFTRSTTFGSRTPEDAICSTGIETDWDGWVLSFKTFDRLAEKEVDRIGSAHRGSPG